MDVRRAEIQNFESISYIAVLENTSIPEKDFKIDVLIF